MAHNLHQSLQQFRTASGKNGRYYSLPALEQAGIGKISRLPVSIRIVLESVLRNCDGKKVTEEHVRQLASWRPNAPRSDEIPFVVARVVLQDFTGVPLLCDLAAMRGVAPPGPRRTAFFALLGAPFSCPKAPLRPPVRPQTASRRWNTYRRWGRRTRPRRYRCA